MKDEIYIHSLDGLKITRLAEGFVGSAYATGRENYPWVFVTMSGFTSPGTIGRYDFTAPPDKRWSIYRTTKLSGLQLDDFETQQVSSWNFFCISADDLVHQVWYNSKDGTKIPMFIVRHKSTAFDGTAPALQYGKKSYPFPAYPSLMPLTFDSRLWRFRYLDRSFL